MKPPNLAHLLSQRQIPFHDESIQNSAIIINDRWAGKAMEVKDWAEAVRIYQLALAQFPADFHLGNNLKYCQERLKK